MLATLTIDNHLATLTLNRPEARNALSPEMLGDMHAAVEELAAVAETGAARAAVLVGAGKAFCAGMDLRAVIDDPAAPPKLLASLAEFTLKLRALPVPTVAKVVGGAIGGGCGLACVCDFAITHPEAKLGYPEVDLGVCPAVVAPWLIKKIGAGPARRVLLEGGTMPGDRAAAIGLVTRCVPMADLDAAVKELTDRLLAAGPHAVRATKRWLNTLDGSDDAAAVRRGAMISAEVVGSPETRAALKARFAKGL